MTRNVARRYWVDLYERLKSGDELTEAETNRAARLIHSWQT